jgi:alcohol dehydrogenase YqhD (iron-dependent ADH family)
MHTLERYFSESKENELSDDIALGLIKSVIRNGEVAYNNPNNYEARANLMLASSLSHCGLTSICKAYKMPVHALEHAVSGLYPHVAHGAGLAVLFPRWARYYVNYDPDKFNIFAKEVFNLSFNDKIKNGLEGIKLLEEFFSSINLEKNFKELGVNNPDISTLVNIVTDGGARVVGHHKKPMDKDVVEEIFKNCI